jgi:hypothetical protein
MGHLASALLFATLLQAGPGSQAGPGEPSITPEWSETEVGDTVTLSLRIPDVESDATPPAIRWISSTPELASVDQDGRVVALSPGTARITAVVGTTPTAATVVIRALPATALEARLPTPAPYAGQVTPLRVEAFDRLGQEVANPEIRFESADSRVARVDPAGLVYARTPGSTTLTISTADGQAATRVDLTVRPAANLTFEITPEETRVRTGDVVRLRAQARLDDSSEPFAAYAAWSVSGTGAQVEGEDGEGVFVAEDPGTYRVTALLGEDAAMSSVIRVEPRGLEAELIQVGRGAIAEHHSGDVWVFEGVDGRDYAYIGTFQYDWMKVWDVTDPGSPILTDSLQLDARRINDVKIHPNNLVGIVTREGASDRRNGIVVLDLSTPAHPTVFSEYTETVTGGVHNVWIVGELDLVYAVHNGTRAIHILDISDPREVREVGRWGLDNNPSSLHDIIVQEGYAYVSYWDDGAVTLDVGAGTHGGTPTEPVLVSRYAYPTGNTHVAWRHGQYLFVGDEIFPGDWDPSKPIEARGYIHVLDMTDMDNPVEVARYEVPEAGVHNVWAEGDRLYVGYYQAGLRVLDISGELRGDLYRQGRELAVLKTTDENSMVPNWPMTWGAQLFKGKIYTSDLNSGLWIAELKELGRPVS